MSLCTLCPRNCRVDRVEKLGLCGVPRDVYISKIMLHRWEEPCISGSRGSGAVFFCGCPLGCVFCQNGEISHGRCGAFAGQKHFTVDALAEAFLDLQEKGAHNLNLVSPTQYTDSIISAIDIARDKGFSLPVVWNTGGYEKRETILSLRGYVDVFLTDMKYFSPHVSVSLSGAANYFDAAIDALDAMCEIVGGSRYEGDIMTRGVIVRHLVLPGCRRDSADLLREMLSRGFADKVTLSLMSQYTPDFFRGCADERLNKSLQRRVTTFEYNSVMTLASELGFSGFGQERESAQKKYTPVWGF